MKGNNSTKRGGICRKENRKKKDWIRKREWIEKRENKYRGTKINTRIVEKKMLTNKPRENFIFHHWVNDQVS